VSSIKPIRLVLKALILFAGFNILFAEVPSLNYFVFKLLMPRLEKFPIYDLYDDPSAEHGFGLEPVLDVGSLFSSHLISQSTKYPNEYRVVFIGDSTIRDGQFYPFINGRSCGGKYLKAYNLGYYGVSATKDLIILQEAMKYSPDLIIWSVTNSITNNNTGFLQANPGGLEKLQNVYGLSDDSIGQDSASYRTDDKIRVEVRLLLYYLVLNPATGNNDDIMSIAFQDARNAAASASRTDLSSASPDKRRALDSEMQTFKRITNNVRIYLINEPRPVAVVNTDRYKQYIDNLTDLSRTQEIKMMDLAELIPEQDFTTSRIHRNNAGDMLFVKAVMPAILNIACASK
jgi:hypothetical protein